MHRNIRDSFKEHIQTIGEFNMPRSISIIGWSTILLSIIIILLGLVNLFEDSSMDQMSNLLKTFPQARTALDSMEDLFLYARIWSIYTILFFCGVLIGAAQFVRYREVGRKILEIACWIGLVNACVDSFLSYILWKNMQAAFSAAMKNMGAGLGNLSLIGTITIILGFFLWIVPSIGMIVYLRSTKLKALMK
jgi:hypothetical protein